MHSLNASLLTDVQLAHPARQFMFFSEGQLLPAPNVGNLARLLTPVRTDDPCQHVANRFAADGSLFALPVVNQVDVPVALLDRKVFIEFFSRPYCREIFGRRNLSSLLHHEGFEHHTPVVVRDSCCVEEVAQIIIGAGMQHMVTGFLVSHNERYLGVVNGHDLLNVITQRKQAELHYLAHYDTLTGIPNRMLLGDRLEQACREADRNGGMVALLFVDVDRFKSINDSLGHRAGDEVLRRLVDRLKASARRVDTVARLGGDEFVILMESLSDATDVELVAKRLNASMRDPIDLHGHSLVVTVSIGSAIYPRDDLDLSALLAKADAAMYEAKAVGGNAYRPYTEDSAMYNPASVLLENELRQAISGDELELHFQPLISLETDTVKGAEALVRWRHPTQGLIPPGEFIPVAEACGLIVPLGQWVICEALETISRWQTKGLPAVPVSINISALQFHQRNFSRFLGTCLARYGVNPQLVELELTESVLMQNLDDVLQVLEEIKILGVRLAIDDFGTGFSSLSYLRRFPIDRLKIDQSFVRDIERLPANASIARAIIALANSLSLDIVAEGIETPIEKAVLQDMGCLLGQGYLLARPMSEEVFADWLARQG